MSYPFYQQNNLQSCKEKSDKPFIFESVQFQNGANTINNYSENFDAVNNAAVTGNTYKYRTDFERMQALIGNKGKSRLSGYYNNLYATFYNLTVVDPTLPSTAGPGGSGWGARLGAAADLDTISISEPLLKQKANKTTYVGVVFSGYIYAPVAGTIQFESTSDDGVIVNFNGVDVISNWTYHAPTTDTSSVVTLPKGYTPIRILYFQGAGGALLSLRLKINGGNWIVNTGCLCCHNYNQL